MKVEDMAEKSILEMVGGEKYINPHYNIKVEKMKDEEMAEEYAEKHSFRVPYDGSNKFYDDTDFKASKDGFLAGFKACAKERLNATTISDCPIKDDQLTEATKLLRFWVNDFYDGFNHSNRYEERHKAIVETEQFLKEVTK